MCFPPLSYYDLTQFYLKMPVAFERGSRLASRPPREVSVYKRERERCQPERRVYREIRSCSLPAVSKRMTSEFISLQEFPGNLAFIIEQGCIVQRNNPIAVPVKMETPAPVPVLKEIPAANWTPPVPFRYGMSFFASQPAPAPVECVAGPSQCMCVSCYPQYMVAAFPEGEMLLPFPPMQKKRRRRGRRGRGARGRKKAAAEAERLANLDEDSESDSESS